MVRFGEKGRCKPAFLFFNPIPNIIFHFFNSYEIIPVSISSNLKGVCPKPFFAAAHSLTFGGP
jgi:hypothetical protein